MKTEITRLAAAHGLTKAQVVRVLHGFCSKVHYTDYESASKDVAMYAEALDVWQEEANRLTAAEVDPMAGPDVTPVKPEWMGDFLPEGARRFIQSPTGLSPSQVFRSTSNLPYDARMLHVKALHEFRVSPKDFHKSVPPEYQDYINMIKRMLSEYEAAHK